MVAAAGGKVAQAPSGGGYLLSHQVNDAFVAVNRLLKAERRGLLAEVARRARTASTYPAGTMFIPARPSTLPILQKLATERASASTRCRPRPPASSMRLKPVRIGLWDQYGGSMPSGWTRWLFEQYEFPFEVVFPADARRGNLNSKFDVLIFVDGGIPMRDGAAAAADSAAAGGRVDSGGVPRLARARDRGEDGAGAEEVRRGRRHDRSRSDRRPSLGYHLGLPIRDALVETVERHGAAAAAREVLRAGLDPRGARRQHQSARATAWTSDAMVFFDESPAFRLLPEAALQGREAGGLVSTARRRCAAAGRGVSSTSIRRCRSSRRRSARVASCCSAPRSPGARSRTGRSSCCSTGSTTAPRPRVPR